MENEVRKTLYRTLGTWRTAGEVGAGRSGKPQEINGLQAHMILHHDMDPEDAYDRGPHELALEHSSVSHHRGG